jgi:metallo-beta-lactamase class B
MSKRRGFAATIATALLAACAAPAERAAPTPAAATDLAGVPACPPDAGPMQGWSDRAPPRRIFGNTYYVGTCGIAAVLVVGDAGAILIDGATQQAPAAILANIRALGFDPRQVKRLLNTHEHMDHAGGLAELQRQTGAPLFARAPAVATLRRGRSDREDPQFGELTGFPPVADVRTLADGEVVRLGGLSLASHATPGHAPGGTSWTWRSCEGARCLDIGYVDSHSALTDGHYRFSDHPAYVAAFERSLKTVAGLPCDLLVTPHPAASNLLARFNGDAPLDDPGACKALAANARANLAARLAEERKEPAQ